MIFLIQQNQQGFFTHKTQPVFGVLCPPVSISKSAQIFVDGRQRRTRKFDSDRAIANIGQLHEHRDPYGRRRAHYDRVSEHVAGIALNE